MSESLQSPLLHASLLQIGLVNAVLATLLAAIVGLVGRRVRRPALMHALWIVVLARLIFPPLIEVPVGFLFPADSANARSEVSGLAAGSVNQPEVARHSAMIGPDGTGAEKSGPPLNQATGKHATGNPATGEAAASAQHAHTWSQWPVVVGVKQGVRWFVHLLQTAAASISAERVFAAWLIGAIVWYSIQAFRIVRFHSMLRTSLAAPAGLQQQAESLARCMGLRRCPTVLLVREAISPMVWGVGPRACLVFPMGLLARLDSQSRGTLLVHELAHYLRGDHWVRVLELVVGGLFWWHPVVWWARRQIEFAEEECCDAWVVALYSDTPRTYAEALLETIEFLSSASFAMPPVASGLGHVPFIRHRLVTIMQGALPRSMSAQGRLAVMLLAVVLLPPQPGPARSAQPELAPSVTVALPAAEARTGKRPIAGFQESRIDQAIRAAALASQATGGALPIPATESAAPEVPPNWATAIAPGGGESITQRETGNVVLRHTATGAEYDLSEYRLLAVAFAPDGRTFAGGGADGLLRLFDTQTATVLKVLGTEDPAAAIQTVTFAPEGRALVAGSRNGRVTVWSLGLDPEAVILPRTFPAVNCVAISADGAVLAVAAGSWMFLDDGRVTLWDLASLREHSVVECDSAVGAVAFAPEGGMLITGEWNGRVTFWDLPAGRRLASAHLSKDVVTAARFSPDTQSLQQIDFEQVQQEWERSQEPVLDGSMIFGEPAADAFPAIDSVFEAFGRLTRG